LATLGLSSAVAETSLLYTLTCTSSAQVCDAAPGIEGGTLTFSLLQFLTSDRTDGMGGGFFFLNMVPARLDDENPLL
jgi:hypothetical protein